MLHLYTDSESPNGYKVAIALQEMGADWQWHPIDIDKGDNKKDEFLAMNPHGRVPVLRDDEQALTLFESATLLLYLAQNQHGLVQQRQQKLLPTEYAKQWQAIQWMIYHSASVGPTIGQYFNFVVSENGKNIEAAARFKRLRHEAFSTIDKHLAGSRDYFVEGNFSIADIAHFGWFYSMHEYNLPFNEYPAIEQWFALVLERPAVKVAIAALK